MNGFAAAMMSACSLTNSGVGFATDAGDPQPATGREVVAFEGDQLHRLHTNEHLCLGGIQLLQVRRADEALEHCDLRECAPHRRRSLSGKLEEAGVIRCGVFEHGRVRLHQDVDGGRTANP
jgi:hypothetical protein